MSERDGAVFVTINRARKAAGLAAALSRGLRAGFRSRPISVVDIGGRGGLPVAWQALWRVGLVQPTFFEPDPDAARALSDRYGAAAHVVGKAAWSAAGPRTLHLTSNPSCSSMLAPSPDDRIAPATRAMYEPNGEILVECVRPDAELARLDVVPEIVKIDVQGGELEVLRGFGAMAGQILCCELEVSFARIYQGQPLFGAVYEYMLDAGFGLLDLKVFGVAGTRRAVQANAFFVRDRMDTQRQRDIEALFCAASDFVYWA